MILGFFLIFGLLLLGIWSRASIGSNGGPARNPDTGFCEIIHHMNAAPTENCQSAPTPYGW